MDILPEVPHLHDEFRTASLGDRRLNDRLLRIVRDLEHGSSSSLPDILGNDSRLEAYYRFTNNKHVRLDDLLAPHQDETVKRCLAHDVVLVIQDSTEFDFSGNRTDMYKLKSANRGFLGHFTLAVSADGNRRPLGVLGYRTVERLERPGGGHWRSNYHDPDKESLRWMEAAAEAAEFVPRSTRLIHVMDREADSYELFDNLVKIRGDFVIRMHHDRRIALDEEALASDEPPQPERALVVSELVTQAEVKLVRSVALSRRGAKAAPQANEKHPPREERDATLEVRACSVVIRRPHHDRICAPELRLNIVHVREPNAPAGQTPVEWTLITTLPIETEADVAAVVDHYRARWLIEEYFKALKTGCGFSIRQQTSRGALERTLALSIPQAWRLLLIRWISRHEPRAPASAVINDVQLKCLQIRFPDARLRTAAEAATAVAKLGGALKSNGPPGWLVLGRGLEKLHEMELLMDGILHASNATPRPRKRRQSGIPTM